MTRFKPSAEQLSDWIEGGLSLTQISKMCGYSVSSVSGFCEEYLIEKPPVGRPKGFKVTEKTRKRMSEAIKRVREELR
jgi:hypothetical protein